ncbi:hypothetical protein GVX82_02430 [Patescibacteria group bacterium]|jgi:ABC-type polysaccharide/polyol phosphate export permease|nr:hypothetical protein [Patescibacteria group bacterium]
MLEKYTLTTFVVAMLSTATLVIFAIWTDPNEVGFMRLPLTCFIIGLASFILWSLVVFYRLAEPAIQALLGVAKRWRGWFK